jgi:hypothetical protein
VRHRKPGTSWTEWTIEAAAVALALPVVVAIVAWAWVLARVPEGWLPAYLRTDDL